MAPAARIQSRTAVSLADLVNWELRSLLSSELTSATPPRRGGGRRRIQNWHSRASISLIICGLHRDGYNTDALIYISQHRVIRGKMMAERLSRKALYDLVWSEPMKTLTSRFGISDVALKKTCTRAAIPTPERGYWAKKDAGKATIQAALPIRPPGMDDEILVAGGGNNRNQYWNKEDLLGPLPPAPEFPEQ
jgi:hypothetical protein